jgi:putative transposase
LQDLKSSVRRRRQRVMLALVPNHAHFLFRTGAQPLGALMRCPLTGYVIGFNRRHRRSGQLFQNRFKSIIFQEETYLRELVRYIHLNPIRAGIVPSLAELRSYEYCGHSALMGKLKRKWQDVDYVLGYFGKSKTEAMRKYESFNAIRFWKYIQAPKPILETPSLTLGDAGFQINLL